METTRASLIENRGESTQPCASGTHEPNRLDSQRGGPCLGEIRSPGSLMGNSVQSHQLSSFDVDDPSFSGEGSWRIGMPWFKTDTTVNAPQTTSETPTVLQEQRYYGGLMNQVRPSIEYPSARPQNIISSFSRFRSGTKQKIKVVISADDDSVSDFHESEWTPQDSAYGAACPVCGFIPKHVRRMIEFSLVAGMVVGFVYLLVTTSIQINNDRTRSKSVNSTSSDLQGGRLGLDDDLYVEYGQNHDDDTWNDDVGYNIDSSGNDDTNNAQNDDIDDSFYGGRAR